jgi:hypothetical protein
MEANDRALERAVRTGMDTEIRPRVTYHNGSGHAQPHVGEQGMRTTYNERSAYGRSSGYGIRRWFRPESYSCRV